MEPPIIILLLINIAFILTLVLDLPLRKGHIHFNILYSPGLFMNR